MKPKEYSAAREALGWTHAKVAETLGLGWRTPYRYASGDVQIPEPAARLLRLLVALRLTTNADRFRKLVEASAMKVEKNFLDKQTSAVPKHRARAR